MDKNEKRFSFLKQVQIFLTTHLDFPPINRSLFCSSSLKKFSLDVIESSVNISQLLFELLQKVYNRDKVNRNYPLTREQLYDLIQFCFCSLY